MLRDGAVWVAHCKFDLKVRFCAADKSASWNKPAGGIVSGGGFCRRLSTAKAYRRSIQTLETPFPLENGFGLDATNPD
jgi:hypothetical protein